MRLNQLFKATMIGILLSLPTLALAMNQIIKCPSANFLKTNFVNALNQVTRIEVNKFTVKYWDNFFDPESNRAWRLEIFADTAEDNDFNEAYRNAKNTLTNLAGPESPYTSIDQPYCSYVGSDDSARMVLAYTEPSLSRSQK